MGAPMTTEAVLPLDPAIEELLRDIAQDPDACLLRVPRPKALSALARGESIEVSGMTGLTHAERELVRVHRDEIAYLLRTLCARLLIERPKTGLRLLPSSRTTLLPAEEWQ